MLILSDVLVTTLSFISVANSFATVVEWRVFLTVVSDSLNPSVDVPAAFVLAVTVISILEPLGYWLRSITAMLRQSPAPDGVNEPSMTGNVA